MAMEVSNKQITLGLMSLAGVFLTFFGTQAKNYVDEINKLQDRVTTLEKSNRSLIDERFKYRSQAYKLQLQIQKKVDSLADLEKFLDYMPMPMYLKEYVESVDEFKVLFINEAYEKAYNITKERYENQFDEVIWPKEFSDKMHEMDSKIIEYKNNLKIIDDILIGGRDGQVYTYKFYVKLGDNKHGVGGVITDHIYKE